MRLSGVKIATLLKATKPVVGRFAAKHGKLSVNAIQSGVPGDGSLPQGQGSFENDPQRLASKLAATTAGAVSAMEGPLTAIKSVISAYNTALTKYPVATKALTSLCGFALGDRIAQSVGGAPFDIFRFDRNPNLCCTALKSTYFKQPLASFGPHFQHFYLPADVCA